MALAKVKKKIKKTKIDYLGRSLANMAQALKFFCTEYGEKNKSCRGCYFWKMTHCRLGIPAKFDISLDAKILPK